MVALLATVGIGEPFATPSGSGMSDIAAERIEPAPTTPQRCVAPSLLIAVVTVGPEGRIRARAFRRPICLGVFGSWLIECGA